MEPNEQALEFDPFLDAELGHQDHAARLHDEGRNLGDRKHPEAFAGHVFLNLGEGCAFAAAWSTSNDYLVDRISSLIPREFLLLILL